MQKSCDIRSFIGSYFIYQHIYFCVKHVFNTWYSHVNVWTYEWTNFIAWFSLLIQCMLNLWRKFHKFIHKLHSFIQNFITIITWIYLKWKLYVFHIKTAQVKIYIIHIKIILNFFLPFLYFEAHDCCTNIVLQFLYEFYWNFMIL
jgi:hypothetical protein